MYKLTFQFLLLGCLVMFQSVCFSQTVNNYFTFEQLTEVPPSGSQTSSLGVAGPIVGYHNEAIIVAGGANFDLPYWDNAKEWHDDIWVFHDGNWEKKGKLPYPLAYGAVVSLEMGVIHIGGNDEYKTFDEVLLLKWDPVSQSISTENLPALPTTVTNAAASLVNDFIYVAGGTRTTDLSTAMNGFWRLDLSNYGEDDFLWEALPTWPGPERAYHLLVTQHNGYHDCLYLMSGRKAEAQGEWDVLSDVYEFDPVKYAADSEPWVKKADMPSPRMAGTATTVGQSHIFVLSGADGTLYKSQEDLKEDHPGFPKQILAFNTITDTWFAAGEAPSNQVTSHSFKTGEESTIIVSGEIKPRIRSPKVWKIDEVQTAKTFGFANTISIVLYLLLLVGIGFFFSFRNKNTENYFRGSQRIPWWAAGCSIFATMLSSLTFMSIPAKTFTTDWLYFFINMPIIILAPFIIHFIIPFFRQINATSAYEYLELRFNLACRLFGSVSYVLFQLGRMAIVMYLPSLALAAVTPISIETSILIMGFLSILYSTLGGLEAVVWTDTLQTFVLLGGAMLSLGLILLNPEIGTGQFFQVALKDHKFRIADWDWSHTGSGIWVVLLGGFGQALIPYSSDQGVIQRYMSVSSVKHAANSVWTNAVLSFIATLLFFSVGTALYVFYKTRPETLDPTYQNDAIFPLFIARQLPVGSAGIVIAGIFAAAQSTISTSMNSISTAITIDFSKRFGWLNSDRRQLHLARWVTLLAGLIGTGFALLISYSDIKSLFDVFLGVLGLFGGAMCGLFILGIFTTRTNGIAALIGAIGGAISLWMVQQFTSVSFLLYTAAGVSFTFIIGMFVSLFFRPTQKEITGLTIYTLKRNLLK